MSKRRSFNSNSNTRRSSKKSSWISTVVAFLIGAILIGCLAAFTPIFGVKLLNPDNLLSRDIYYENILEKFDKGDLKATWREDGSFYLTGKYEDSNQKDNATYSYEFATVTLEPGTYTLSSGNKRSSTDGYHLYIFVEGETHTATDNGKVTFTVEAAATAVVGFTVKNNDRIIYANFEPVLVSGDKAGDFVISND